MKKKICFVVASPFTAKAFLLNHINALSEYFDIYLVANLNGFDKVKLEGFNVAEIKDIAIERGIRPWNDLKALSHLTNYLKKNQFEAVHTVTPKAGLLGMIAAKRAGIIIRTHIFTGQVWHTKTGWFKKLLMYLDKKIVNQATYILVDGESQREFLIEHNIITSSNSRVLGRGSISGVDASRFIPDKSTKLEVRKELGINTDDIVFMFLGRMNLDKGIPELGRAFERLSNERPNCKLLLVGADEDDMFPLLRSIIHKRNKLIYYGVTSEPERFLQACDVFCLPSHREGFGTSVIEASLLEKPIICSDTYGLKETIIEYKTGLRHKVNDVDSLYKAMLTMYDNEKMRKDYGENGRKYVLNNFTAQAITEEWVNFYKSILNV
ncbi:MAG: glycosyltransferase family 4 protein [Flavobacteriaceae bacterium]|nr:glycosyltransferase family 4 protein [Flavobacteriaceae bacterium]